MDQTGIFKAYYCLKSPNNPEIRVIFRLFAIGALFEPVPANARNHAYAVHIAY
jgi:hypothetical protein